MPLHTAAALAGVTCAALGAALSVPLARLAAARTAAQPAPVDLDAERAVIDTVLADPLRYRSVSLLPPQAFVDPGHAATWAALQDAVRDDVSLVGGTALGTHPDTGTPLPEGDLDPDLTSPQRLAGVLAVPAGVAVDDRPLSDRDLLRAGEQVLFAYEGRTSHAGAAPVAAGQPGEAPLVRRVQPVTRTRAWAAALTTGAGFAVLPLLAGTAAAGTDGVAATFAALAALALLLCTGLVVALVDIDTLLLDSRTMVAGGSAAVAGALLAVAGGAGGAVLPAVAVGAAACVAVEGVDRVYRRVRGVSGWGGGDTTILLFVVTVPALLLGPTAGLVAATGAMLLAVPHHLVGAWLDSRRGRVAGSWTQTPRPLGPVLACSWPFSLAVAVLAGWVG